MRYTTEDHGTYAYVMSNADSTKELVAISEHGNAQRTAELVAIALQDAYDDGVKDGSYKQSVGIPLDIDLSPARPEPEWEWPDTGDSNSATSKKGN